VIGFHDLRLRGTSGRAIWGVHLIASSLFLGAYSDH
jgi:hypothetical protein